MKVLLVYIQFYQEAFQERLLQINGMVFMRPFTLNIINYETHSFDRLCYNNPLGL